MKKRHLGLLFLTGSLLLLLSACEYDFIVPAPKVTPPANDTISFSQDIQPFFAQKCVTCHHGSQVPDLSISNAYASIVPDYVVAESPETSELYTICQPSGSMGEHTTAEQLALLYRWIYAGAKND